MEKQDIIIPEGPQPFGAAIYWLKHGRRVARLGWNGKGMYIVLVLPAHNGDPLSPHWSCPEMVDELNNQFALRAFIGMKTADNYFIPWFASQSDIFAEDWVVVT